MTPFDLIPPLRKKRARQVTIALCVLIALGIAALDAVTPSNLLPPIIYGVPLVLCAWADSPQLLWSLAALLVGLTFGMYVWGPSASPREAAGIEVVNRCLASISTVIIAWLVHLWLRAARTVDEERRVSEKQNRELESVNQEVGQREEEIVRQNEELQSQTEELERQSEELRVTNEELASREKMLEQLLELSRSLTAELSRDDVLKKVCESLGMVLSGSSVAVLERHGDSLRISCHHRFGPDGPEAETVPFSNSFASLIMSVGQTGYLPDIALRPDVSIPQPKSGPRFRTVISTPLRVNGRCVGTLEVYGQAPQTWADSQVSIVESLAAQVSISLQSAQHVETIREERRRFEAVFRTVPVGMAVADDPEGQVVRLNPAGAAMFGLALDENVSATTPTGARLRRSAFRGGRVATDDEFPLIRALHGEEVRGEELDFVLPDGRRIALLMSAAPFYDARGRITGAASAFADISNQKRLMRELEVGRREAEEASVRKTRFLAAVSHDIRTPANAIHLMAEVIRRASADPAINARIPDMVQKLQSNVLAMVDLVEELLDISRFDSGKIELLETEFSLGDLIEEERAQLQPLADEKGLDLVMEPPERPVFLRTDRVKLARVLGNLIGNAIKFTTEGNIRLSVATHHDPDRRILIRVVDTGIGIAEEHLPRIFDEFIQLRNPERDRRKGTGLGLAICKRLIDVIGGSIGVESRVNEGTTFTLALPATAVALRLDSAPPVESRKSAVLLPSLDGQSLPKLSVLLVEDHATTREGTRQILLQEGANVFEAPDGETAIQLIRHGGMNVVLLDLMLPDMDGREVLKKIREERPAGLKGVLILTGDLTPARLSEMRELGADAVIGKPIDVGKLLQALQTFRRAADA